MRHFSLIDRHLESISRTEPVFELNLAPSEKRCQVTESYKSKTTLPCKIGRGIFNLVALALTVTELFNKVCEKV